MSSNNLSRSKFLLYMNVYRQTYDNVLPIIRQNTGMAADDLADYVAKTAAIAACVGTKSS